jgi:signal transduction histidine kinase
MIPRRNRLRIQLTLLYAIPFFATGAVLTSVPLFGVKSTSVVGQEPAHPPESQIESHGSFTSTAIALAVLTVLSLLVGWWVAGRFVRPLRTLTATAREISATNLNRRLDLADRKDEYGELAETLDDLFARLNMAFESQRRFVANASHELRTPLTAERALLQVALADPAAGPEDLRRVCGEVLALGRRQERLIDALLTLASSEQGVERRLPFDLCALVAEAVDARRDQAAARGIHLTAKVSGAPAVGNPGSAGPSTVGAAATDSASVGPASASSVSAGSASGGSASAGSAAASSVSAGSALDGSASAGSAPGGSAAISSVLGGSASADPEAAASVSAGPGAAGPALAGPRDAGSGMAGSAMAGSGLSGSGLSGSGRADSGQAGLGQAGLGQAGLGQAGSGQAGSGQAGPGWVVGDPNLVGSLVANLLDNALRHNVPGGRVEVVAERNLLSVSNDGPVVPADEVEGLFEPFRQLGGDRLGNKDGHGLGLAIVRAIATAHGAALTATPRPGGGLDVCLTFPEAGT